MYHLCALQYDSATAHHEAASGTGSNRDWDVEQKGRLEIVLRENMFRLLGRPARNLVGRWLARVAPQGDENITPHIRGPVGYRRPYPRRDFMFAPIGGPYFNNGSSPKSGNPERLSCLPRQLTRL